jgi:hypothetical protein
VRRLNAKQTIASLLLHDINMSTDQIAAELDKRNCALSKLAITHLRSTIRDVLRYLASEGLLVSVRMEDANE